MEEFYNPKLRMETIITEKEIISCTLYDDILKRITEWIIDTQDKSIRKALIELGWTPPKDKNESTRTDKFIK